MRLPTSVIIISISVCIVLCAIVLDHHVPAVEGRQLRGRRRNAFSNIRAAQRYRFRTFLLQKQRRKNKVRDPFFGRRNAGATGHAIINGEYVDTNRVLLQKPTLMGIGYFAYDKPKIPIFIRKQTELQKRYIAFQDPHLPPGEGYLVVLKKIPPKQLRPSARMLASNMGAPAQVPYEAFHLQLGSNIFGSIDRLNIRRLAYDIRTHFSSRKATRNSWLRHRSHFRRRFGISKGIFGRRSRKWRGRRSLSVNNDTQIEPGDEDLTNPCYISRLNVTDISLRVRSDNDSQNVTNLESDNYDFDYDSMDFQYFM